MLVTRETEEALSALLKSLGANRAHRYDKITLALSGCGLNDDQRLINLEFCIDISDPFGYWEMKKSKTAKARSAA